MIPDWRLMGWLPKYIVVYNAVYYNIYKQYKWTQCTESSIVLFSMASQASSYNFLRNTRFEIISTVVGKSRF